MTMGMVLRRSLRVGGRLPGQENQGRVGALGPLPHVVCNLDRGDVSTGDDDDKDNHSSGNRCMSREILHAVDVGMGLMLCPPAPMTGPGMQTRVLVNRRAARPLP